MKITKENEEKVAWIITLVFVAVVLIAVLAFAMLCLSSFGKANKGGAKVATTTTTVKSAVSAKAKEPKAKKEALKNNVVVISDSYGSAEYSQIEFVPVLRANGVNVTQYAVQPGAGFNTNEGIYAYKTQINKLIKDYGVSQVIVISGYNDIWNASAETIAANAIEFNQIAAEKFPNAKVRYYFCGKNPYDKSPEYIKNYKKAYSAWTVACKGYNAEMVAGAENIIVNGYWFQNDYVHPTADGVKRLAKFIAASILNGKSIGDTGEKYDLDAVQPTNTIADQEATYELIEYTANPYSSIPDINVVIGEIKEG